jgi:hypothetical protein
MTSQERVEECQAKEEYRRIPKLERIEEFQAKKD